MFLANLVQENVFYDILKRKNAFLCDKNTRFKKSKNWHFSQGVNLWFWSKNGHFFNFFLGNLDQENVFYDILEQKKTAFLRYKNKKSKKPKNWHFSKGVNPWFWSKNGHFLKFFFLSNLGQENLFYDILERNKAFVGYKIKKFEKLEELTFFPRVLVQKCPFFERFFFWQLSSGKCLLRYSRTKKRLSTL